MQPKSIIIQTHSKKFFDKIYYELQDINCINFWGKKINSIYTITIKCINYYQKFDIDINYNFIGTYIFLYSNLSLILSDLIISEYELLFVNRIIKENFFYFPENSQKQIRSFNLPVIPNRYFVELREAKEAMNEIVKELEKKPITIETLNTRVDTARDLALKLYGKTKEMMKTAMFAEMAIVYGNRYRSSEKDLDRNLTYSEMLFVKGEYKKSLELTINSLNKIEPGIYDKLLKLYGGKERMSE